MKTPSPKVMAAPASPGLIRFVSELPPGPHHAVRLWSAWNFVGYFDDPCEESQAVFRHRLIKAGMAHLSSYRLVKQP